MVKVRSKILRLTSKLYLWFQYESEPINGIKSWIVVILWKRKQTNASNYIVWFKLKIKNIHFDS